MAENLRIPPCRNLDIYRLVVARGLKQADVAVLFSVSPVRICQIVRRVRRWVDDSIGDWLFPRRDDLRFYAALEMSQIRVHELENDPENVLFAGLGWTYRRAVSGSGFQPVEHGQDGRATAATATSPATNTSLPLSAAPLNSLPSPAADTIGATPSAASDFAPSHINDLAHRLAELLILWQKSRRLSGAFKAPSFAGKN